MERRPYVLIKDRATLSVVDLKNKKATIGLCRIVRFQVGLDQRTTISTSEMSGDGKYLNVFTIEGEQRE
jgi:hypothetical protein